MEDLVAIKEDIFIMLVATWTQLFLLLDFESSSPLCLQAEILGAAIGAEMADIAQMKKIVPLITCETPFRQHVCELVFGVNVTDLNFWVQINPVSHVWTGNRRRVSWVLRFGSVQNEILQSPNPRE